MSIYCGASFGGGQGYTDTCGQEEYGKGTPLAQCKQCMREEIYHLKSENESLRNAYEAGIKHSDEAASKYIEEHWRPIRKELDDCADSLPGSYYMEPPDGGDASISVQVSRMAEDAKRYRWLRDKGSLLGAIDYACMGWKDGEIDRAIDNLMCSLENH